MPCRDYYDDHPQDYYGPKLASKDAEINKLKKQVSFAESALCAALQALEHVDTQIETVSPKVGDFYDWLNFNEAGITKADLEVWHERHKELDMLHRAAEAERKHKEAEEKRKKQDAARKKAAALSKLSEEEKKLLGIK